MSEQKDYIITSVAKALKVLKEFGSDENSFTLTQLSQKCGIGKTSMLRILSTFESEGFIRYDSETRKYRLGFIMYQLGSKAYGISDIKKLCHTPLWKAAVKSGQVIHLATIAEDRVVVIDRIWATSHVESMGLIAKVGGEVPVHCTGVGQVLAAYSDKHQQERLIANCRFERYSDSTITNPDEFRRCLVEVKERGWAVNDGEHEPYLKCLTRPFFGANGKIIAAFSISALKEVFTDEKFEEYNKISIETASVLNKIF